MKVEESLNVTFDESPSSTKLSPLVDDDVGKEEAIEDNIKKSRKSSKGYPTPLHMAVLVANVAQEASCFILSSELLTSGLNRWRVAQKASCLILSSELLTSGLLNSGLNRLSAV
ncbi:hypothetical protein Tco_0536115 [Tanacetum coccineum]